MGVLDWRSVKGYDGRYLVSNTGLIYSNISNKVLKPNKMTNGYLSVELFKKDGKSKRILIHRIVAEAFIDNPESLPIVNHKDEDKTNNSADNLEWCTQKYNANYGNALEKKRRNWTFSDVVKNNLLLASKSRQIPVLQFTKSGEFLKRFNSAEEAGRLLKINASHIGETCKQIRKSAGGFCWQYERSVDLSVL